ncbi:DUF2515 domain-containing protein [Bacillus carboniphilus]|uniref:DUF2515 domain-containing protein n=1 Tax=Bacillus carboniphilus TaxID=86663 RepID=A0ABN0WVN9_9BACI
MNIYPILQKLNNQFNRLTDGEVFELIQHQVRTANQDNISRTKAYRSFFQEYPEIKWAFLASMVSRNAGWNMCDLEGEWYPKILSPSFRYQLFLTYERANWLIFQDAYPQLLTYHYMTLLNRDLFHLLPKFHVSQFMGREWEHFKVYKDQNRLLYALIVNEQHLIQKPVIEDPILKHRVFKTKMFSLQDFFHYSCVLFPTLTGELYGASVTRFRDHRERIKLGKKLAFILFKPGLFPYFIAFSNEVEPTGSRWEYEQFQANKRFNHTPILRTTYPIIPHHVHQKSIVYWEKYYKVKKGWRDVEKPSNDIRLTDWYESKRHEVTAAISIEQVYHYRKRQKK